MKTSIDSTNSTCNIGEERGGGQTTHPRHLHVTHKSQTYWIITSALGNMSVWYIEKYHWIYEKKIDIQSLLFFYNTISDIPKRHRWNFTKIVRHFQSRLPWRGPSAAAARSSAAGTPHPRLPRLPALPSPANAMKYLKSKWLLLKITAVV